MQRFYAFSVLELLVVIAVIAILAALLLPTLNKAKNQGAKAGDLSNLRQVMMAVHVYTDDNKDILPWPNWDYGTVMHNGVARPGWLYTINAATSGPAAFNGKAGLLWDSLHGGKVLRCSMDNPAQVYVKSDGTSERRAQQLSTYIMNGAVIGFRTGYHSNATPVKATQMLPTDCILFEADERTVFAYNDGSSWPTEGVTRRHFNGATCAAVDGSSSYIRDDTWQSLVDDPGKNSVWCYPLTADGGDPVYGHE
ncbi:MAG TPA: type II secretion system protein [Verrucomicrobiae bacterium]|nr:type II secretion system protein [Verrucomicrobiae bacterium]